MTVELHKPAAPGAEPEHRCSFCFKRSDEVKKLIAGPTVMICDECVVLCMDIITEEKIAVSTPFEHQQMRVQCLQFLSNRIAEGVPIQHVVGDAAVLEAYITGAETSHDMRAKIEAALDQAGVR